jgi:hypothetical protein
MTTDHDNTAMTWRDRADQLEIRADRRARVLPNAIAPCRLITLAIHYWSEASE